MWRAAIPRASSSFTGTRRAFQYRERYVEGCNALTSVLGYRQKSSFNTENGMWRAAIKSIIVLALTVLVFQYRERYVEGCNLEDLPIGNVAFVKFQYRERYVEGCNSLYGSHGIISRKFQYRERYVEGCNSKPLASSMERRPVSIPRTVCGGLQFGVYLTGDVDLASFNTENGMWRAAIVVSLLLYVLCFVFQYRERYVEGCNFIDD